MNDNQEKNNLDEDILTEAEETDVPIAKKVAKFSAFIYLGLAITVVIVATVGIFSISYDYEEQLEPIYFPEASYPEYDYSEPSNLPSLDFSVPDATVGNDQSGVDADLSEEESEPEPERVLFYRPVEGEVIKEHCVDRLVFSETMGDYRAHTGIDIAAEAGTSVLCFTDGIVSSIVDDYFYGVTVAVTHDQGLVSYYMNLDPELAYGLSVGSEVAAGEEIGVVGTSARIEASDESHLHFELRVNGELIDPVPEIPE